MHTGYAQTAYNEADKMERNVKMLRDEHERDPENPHIMLYLADSIKAAGTEEARDEAEQLYLKALNGKKQADAVIKRLAYDFLIPRFSLKDDKKEEAARLCGEAIATLPNHIDYYYYRAVLRNRAGEYSEAQEDLLMCERAFLSGTGAPETRVLMPSPILLYHQLYLSAHGLGDEQAIDNYTTIINAVLTEGKAQPAVLGPYMAEMFRQGKTGIEVFEKISTVYDLNEPRDLMLIARAAKDYGILLFAQKVMEMAGELLSEK